MIQYSKLFKTCDKALTWTFLNIIVSQIVFFRTIPFWSSPYLLFKAIDSNIRLSVEPFTVPMTYKKQFILLL